MPEITLTTFVDFVTKVGTPRLTCVREAKELYGLEYSPAFDFWRPLRNAIVDMHRYNRPKDTLDTLLLAVSEKKKKSYRKCVHGYKKWMGRKSILWVGCSAESWVSGSLTVRVNPELGIRIEDKEYIVKLYFKSEKLSKNRVDAILYLIKKTLPENRNTVVPAVLDVQTAHFIPLTTSVVEVETLLNGEAAAFVAMWNQI